MTAKPLVDQFMDAVTSVVREAAPGLAVGVESVRPRVDQLAAEVIANAETALRSGAVVDAGKSVGAALGGIVGAALGTPLGGPVGIAIMAPVATGIGEVLGETLAGLFTTIAEQFLAAQAPTNA